MAESNASTTIASDIFPEFCNTKFPVLLPKFNELDLSDSAFSDFIRKLVTADQERHPADNADPATGGDTAILTYRFASDEISSGAGPSTASVASVASVSSVSSPEADPVQASPFMDALLGRTPEPKDPAKRTTTTTTNGDPAYLSTKSPLVDLFYELQDHIGQGRLIELLDGAWDIDANATLRIIWNTRSIHLGKGCRVAFYRAIGWLAERHPATMLLNLVWLSRPVLAKKSGTPAAPSTTANVTALTNDKSAATSHDDDTFELVDMPESKMADSSSDKSNFDVGTGDCDRAAFDVRYGVSHGYWKDVLNILALAARSKLSAHIGIISLNYIDGTGAPLKRREHVWAANTIDRDERHADLLQRLDRDVFYKALHLTVARLFADQLRRDLRSLTSKHKKDRVLMSMAAKWAPSNKCMHDRETCIVSTIAESLYPLHQVKEKFIASAPADFDPSVLDRSTLLKLARHEYQTSTLGPLRRHLKVVERSISSKRYADINYAHVPSLAMVRYTSLFIDKDAVGFESYLSRVMTGQSSISGATLTPSKMVRTVQELPSSGTRATIHTMLASRTLDLQWETLVRRMRESGVMESSIAVCDVSASMEVVALSDGTRPIHSSIGLSLLLAEVTAPPFGGVVITFHSVPRIIKVGGHGDPRSFSEKVRAMKAMPWGGHTDLVAVFGLILGHAKEAHVPAKDMVKRVFVFSDMQFDAAEAGIKRVGDGSWAKTLLDRYVGDNQDKSENVSWSSSYERIRTAYGEAGYEMPELVFWNLAGAACPSGSQDSVTTKPVDSDVPGTTLVGGYSQAQLKVFMDGGHFDADEQEIDLISDGEYDFGTHELGKPDDDDCTSEGDGDAANGQSIDESDVVVIRKRKRQTTPLDLLYKAIGHGAYDMLKVVD